jgi:YVTN family beta-propeller protein
MSDWVLRVVAVAAVAGSMATGAAAETVYVPLGNANAVLVVDGSRDAITDRIDGISAVHGLAATPDGRYLIAGSYEEREPGKAMPEKPAGMTEDAHAAHHAPKTPTASGSDPLVSAVSVIRTSDRSIVRRIDVPGAVHHVAVSPDGRYAVVTRPNQDAISAIDLVTYETVPDISTGSLPNYAVFSPDGRLVYVSNAGDGRVSEIDASEWTVRRSYAVGGSPEHLVLSKDGATLYVNNVDDGTVSVLDLEKQRLRATIKVGQVPHGIDLSDDGQTLFVTVMGEDKVVAVDVASGDARTVVLRPAPYHLAAIRGAGKLYVSSAEAPKLWVLDQQKLKVIGEIEIGGKGHQMVQAAGS